MARILWAGVFTMFLRMSVLGQIASTTSLVGTVTDSHGASIVGAKVTAVNQGTRDTYNATTNDRGYYSIEFIRVGVYDLTVEQPGFQKITKAGIVVNINQAVRTDLELTVGALSQSVTIEAQRSVDQDRRCDCLRDHQYPARSRFAAEWPRSSKARRGDGRNDQRSEGH
jgi:hypothetical protein